MKKTFKTIAAFAIIAAFILSLAACGNQPAQTTEIRTTETETTMAPETTAAEGYTEEDEPVRDEIPYGSPFTTTIDAGNLPDSKGSPADDLNVYYNYDFYNENRDTKDGSTYAALHMGEFMENVIKYFEDESITAPGMDQLRLFISQAMDMETADARGYQDVEPYLDMIDSAGSIEEVNAVLSSPDFPFSPFMTTLVGVYDMSDENIFSIYPNFILYDFLSGAQYMQDAETEEEQKAQKVGDIAVMDKMLLAGESLKILGVPESECEDVLQTARDFEKQYGKLAFYDNLIVDTEYGELGQYYNLLTMEDLDKKITNFPVHGILAKDGRDKSKLYSIMNVEWLEALDKVWTEENLDVIKLIAKLKVFMECAPYLDSRIEKISIFGRRFMAKEITFYSDDFSSDDFSIEGQEIDLEKRAYAACDNLDTFAQLIAKLYVDNCIGQKGRERIEKMALDIRETFIGIFEKTSWLDEDSKEALLKKIEAMSFNILEPESGYFDYGDLQLVPSEEGGTLIGNYLLLKKYRIDKENELIGKEADSGCIFSIMKPSTLNCFYMQEGNCINIMPGFANSSYYEESMTDEELYGGLGYVIAHEIGHSFDTIGSQYDERGMLNCCFTGESLETYLEKCNKLKEYYDNIYIGWGKYADGKKVLAEACADLCGTHAVIDCSENMEGFDYEKFFERFALNYRDIGGPEYSTLMLVIDTHPMAHLRINVNAQMDDKFYEVYDVKEGDNMYLPPEDRIYIYGK